MPQLLVMRCVARGRPYPEWKNQRQRRIIFRCRSIFIYAVPAAGLLGAARLALRVAVGRADGAQVGLRPTCRTQLFCLSRVRPTSNPEQDCRRLPICKIGAAAGFE
jgi:hypothetical protein